MREAKATIPLVDLSIQHDQVAREVEAGWARVVGRGDYILGDEVDRFEEAYAGFCGVAECVGVANGTDAIELALRAAGVGPGHEVILPANSFVATAEAVVRAGAAPILVDVDPQTSLIDVSCVEAELARRTGVRAIVPVDLYGQVAPMEELSRVADGRAVVIEDAAQSHGARRHGATAGGFGLAAATSFYPGKNLGAYGDAGAVLTSSQAVAGEVRALRNHGSRAKYEHPRLGFNSRLDALQAVVLLAKLHRLAEWNEERRAAARRYHDLLRDLPGVDGPVVLEGNEHVWHLYVIRVPERDRVLGRFRDAGIEAGIHYPIPIHLQGAFAFLGHRRGDFPISEALAERVLSLPIFPGITPEQQERVADEVRRALR